MRSLAFLSISFKRLRSRAGLTALLILGTALTVGIIVCVPVFAGAVSRRIMREEFSLRSKWWNRSTFSVRFSAMATPRRPMTLADAAYDRHWIADMLVRYVGLPVDLVYMEYKSPMYHLCSGEDDEHHTSEYLDSVRVACVEHIEDHIKVAAGASLGNDTDVEFLSVWVERNYADELALQVGDTYDLVDPYSAHVEAIPVKIAGFWEALDPDEKYWGNEPSWHFRSVLMTTRYEYETHVYPRVPGRAGFVSWYYVLDDRRMNLDRAEHYINGLKSVSREVEKHLCTGRMDSSPMEELVRGHQRKTALSLVLLGFSVPLMAIVMYFIGAVSSMVAHFQSQEIAMLTSRGSGRLQIIGLTLLETIIILAFATPLGILLGMGLARLLGYSSSFLRFVSRAPLQVNLASVNWRLVGAAIGVSVIFRLVPTWSAAKLTVIIQERRSARSRATLGATRLSLIALLSGGTLYAYRQLAQIGSLSLISWRPNDPSHDPLLLLAPSLFLLTAPLIASELFTVLMRPLALIGKMTPSIVGHLGCINLAREGGQYRTPIYMLVLCLSFGVLYASIARTADVWLTDRRRYEVGSDLTFRFSRDTEDADSFGGPGDEALDLGNPSLIPISDYQKIDGVLDAMPVGEYVGATPIGRTLPYVRLLGIDRLAFPRVAYCRSDFSSRSLGELMNALGAQPDGILLPADVAAQSQLGLGESFRLNLLVDEETRHPFQFVIVGTFDYFPTMFEDEAPVFVANLDYLQMGTAGMLPHGIWMRLAPEADSEQVLGDVKRLHVGPTRVRALREILADDHARLERVGLFGMLSICFLVGALLSSLGLLAYNAASMVRRSLRFAILQAMGMTRNEIIRVVFVEYVVTLLYSVLAGAALGVISARLFVPFFPLTETKGIPIPPYVPLIDSERAFWMALVMAFGLAVIESVVLVRLMRARVFETLRLGMRE